jgi:Protein of unknown function (DUF1176)
MNCLYPALVATVCFLMNGPVQASGGFVTDFKTFRDWSVTCNNVKSCAAYSVSTNSEGGLVARPRGLSDSVAQGWMVIERDAGPTAMPIISLSRSDLENEGSEVNGKVQLVTADGRMIAGAQFGATVGRRGALVISSAQTATFLRLARRASHAIFINGQTGRAGFFVSLSGLVASGRSMDATQGRTNTRVATIDVGNVADSRVPAAPALPTVTARPFTARAGGSTMPAIMRARASDCDDAQRFDPGGTNIKAYALGGGKVLWAVPCGAGAYNTWDRFYIQTDRNTVTSDIFIGPPRSEDDDANSFVNASVDPAKGVITAFSKGRGLGDCGVAETWAWNGRAFEIAKRLEMIPCGGILADFWPSTFAATLKIGAQQR